MCVCVCVREIFYNLSDIVESHIDNYCGMFLLQCKWKVSYIFELKISKIIREYSWMNFRMRVSFRNFVCVQLCLSSFISLV